jgi:predicted AAA+ superfamily ATPase
MKRKILANLAVWINKENRKPLVLKGARQVGKSFIVEELGKQYFENYFRIDFLADKKAHSIFDDSDSLHAEEILKRISIYTNKVITAHNTLLFLDEIQECAQVLKTLKFFTEEMPELAIICAGSYLGIMTNEESFPVGKVEFLEMYPMTFGEFLAVYKEDLHKIYEGISIEVDKLVPIPKIYHELLIDAWRTYQAIGGMPEVVREFIKKKDSLVEAYKEARKIQNQLLIGYQSDFAKHARIQNATHILNVFDSVSAQLAKSYDEGVKKFQFTGVIPQKKGFENIRGPLTWLEKSHLVLKNFIVKKSEHPLKVNIHDNQFKLYYFDVGLLNASLEIPMEALFQAKVGEYKGYIAENFVIQELKANLLDQNIYSWQENRAEVEFLITIGADIVPIEVKSTANYSRAKSLDSYMDRYNPELAIKLTPKNIGYDTSKRILSLPIYLAGLIVPPDMRS